MSEDVSVQIRLAVTVALLASTVSIVANVLTFSLVILGDFRDSFVDAANSSTSSVVYALEGKSNVESSVIYKVIRECGDVQEVRIVLEDGTSLLFDFDESTSGYDLDVDSDWFILNATKRFRVKVELREGFKLSLQEVVQ